MLKRGIAEFADANCNSLRLVPAATAARRRDERAQAHASQERCREVLKRAAITAGHYDRVQRTLSTSEIRRLPMTGDPIRLLMLQTKRSIVSLAVAVATAVK